MKCQILSGTGFISPQLHLMVGSQEPQHRADFPCGGKSSSHSSALLSARSRLPSRVNLSDVTKGKTLWPQASLQRKARTIHWKEWKCTRGADVSIQPRPLGSYSAHGEFMNVAFYLSNHISPVLSLFHCKTWFPAAQHPGMCYRADTSS